MVLLQDVLKSINPIRVFGHIEAQSISRPINLSVDNTDPEVLMWVNDQHTDQIASIQAGIIICPAGSVREAKQDCVFIEVEAPRRVFQQILEQFFVKKRTVGVASSSSIHPSVVLGKEVFIGEFVVIEANCTLGDFVAIDHHTVLKEGTILHDHVTIGSNCVIGGVGFGYEKDEAGNWTLMPHLGNVVLHNHVEIGNCTTIDRAVLGSTELQPNVKVDNLVHIAHGVQIGRNSLVIAHAMIGGSTVIGSDVWVAPAASILNKMTVGDQSLIGMGAVVIRPVNAGETIVGNPGRAVF